MSTAQRPPHGGPLHRIPDKVALALHIGEDHVSPSGTVHRIAGPSVRVRQRWTRQELESTHAELHRGVWP